MESTRHDPTTQDPTTHEPATTAPTAPTAQPPTAEDRADQPASGWSDAERHPLDDEPRPVEERAPETPVRRRRGLSGARHTTSSILALLAVPGAYGAFDHAWVEAGGVEGIRAFDGRVPDQVMLAVGIGAACLLLAALAGRISGLGPLLAGLVWGAAPTALVLLDYSTYRSRLDDLPELWDNTGFGLYEFSLVLFPAVAALLLGAALAGRWRRVPVTT